MSNRFISKSLVNATRGSFSTHAFRWEITLVLVIKLLAIIAIKVLFFSDPVDLSHPEHRIENQLGLGTTPQPPTTAKEKPDG